MSNEIGSVVWVDLTVADAEGIRDFYREVVGWRPEPVDMGEYEDYNMTIPASGKPAVGVCHARDTNANVPPAWLIYVAVPDVTASAQRCVELGGKIMDGPRLMGPSLFCAIQDPAGAMLALYETKQTAGEDDPSSGE
jgi:predicted enzyme related to lactoylglutathione lyase